MFRSLRSRLGAVFLGFLILVAASAAATALTVNAQIDDARVINLAGRQRMLTQQMAWLALSQPDHPQLVADIDRFERTLRALRDGGTTLTAADRSITLPPAPDQAILARLSDIAQTWHTFRASLQPPNAAGLQAAAPVILAQLDQLVSEYELRAQAKVIQLQMIQTTFLMFALALVVAGYFLMRRQIIQPLSVLETAARQMAKGQLTGTLPRLRDDELGEVGRAFETMRAEIISVHDQLEARVDQRTWELAAAFELSQEIVGQIDLDRLLQSVVDQARTLTSAAAASLCLIDRESRLLSLAAISGAGSTQLHMQQTLNRHPAQQVVGQGATVVVDAGCTHCGFLCAHAPGCSAVAPLRTSSATLGALCVVRQRAPDFDANETRALTLLANSAAVAIANARLVEQQKQQAEQAAIAVERDRLAVELHDNLAQTLSFLNLKSDRVHELLGDRQFDQASGELAQMKQAIGTAYQQVRAALTGLREAPPDGDNLRARLSDCVAEMNTSSEAVVELKVVDASALALPRVAQAQAYHIVREALTNARRHAQAQHVSVIVSRHNGTACFAIEDDGQGFERAAVDEHQHLGLNIMRTRAERCGGTLQLESELGKGTKVTALLPVLAGLRQQ